MCFGHTTTVALMINCMDSKLLLLLMLVLSVVPPVEQSARNSTSSGIFSLGFRPLSTTTAVMIAASFFPLHVCLLDGFAVHCTPSSQALDGGILGSARGNEANERGGSRTTGRRARLFRSSDPGRKGTTTPPSPRPPFFICILAWEG